MIKLVRIEAQSAQTYKAIRLAALKQDPLSFGSTYEREVSFSDKEWLTRASSLDGEDRVGFFALEDEEAFGLVVCFRDNKDPTVGDVISMWVAPIARRRGVGSDLLKAIRHWAQERGIQTLRLLVTSLNASGISFYERNGFVRTGKTAPYPHTPDIFEIEMTLSTCG
ncbi:GNAT family N-acetyltransferase [Dyella lipolytica]|uniref:GNAT family N-acetyltransferase n=1 Tax=Dyella lipolytica TaxID=1867835 RepID=A0ABW8IU18_9GAMM|nr:GNAT family N-acetyltransferase [Dyella lipolytica]GLQ46258.1 GNAT family N-acetyltransferase [Dyella lipolytica]